MRLSVAWTLLLLAVVRPSSSLNSLPDASQEGLLSQFNGYPSLSVFHYTVPPEVTRATWEFASFQDHPSCPRRSVNIFIQQGSFPVFPAGAGAGENASLPANFYLRRTGLSRLSVVSEYQPNDSVVHPVYNPQPGSWYAVAYLAPFEEAYGLRRRCRYSLGSIALWTRAEGGVELILANTPQTFKTRRHFSYYKFSVPDAVDAFKLTIRNCTILVRRPRPNADAEDTCIDFVDIRAGALPFHRPDDSPTGVSNITSTSNASFFEPRPYRDSIYYVIVVSHGTVTFEVDLQLKDCGETGLYGRQQREWYLSERGLMWSDKYNASQPKEPKTGFQLLTTRPLSKILLDNGTSEGKLAEFEASSSATGDSDDLTLDDSTCISTFDFTRIDNVAEFTVNYLLQGRSWYTKWLTVVEHSPVVTRFDTLDFIDIGGFVNVRLRMDDAKTNAYMYQEVRACLSHRRQADVDDCDPHALIKVTNEVGGGKMKALRVIPYPEPGKWYLTFQSSCVELKSNETKRCPKSLTAAMVSVELHIQPCDYRPPSDMCGDHGVCAKASKGQFRFSACTCFSGYGGWTCDEPISDHSEYEFMLNTLFLTLSNFAFLPAVFLALKFRLFTEALIYTATMLFSTFYHTCDREALTMNLPRPLEGACEALYVHREVLQFCDFYCATLSFWITIISLAKLPHRLVNFLHISGVLLVAVLVQYNRTGITVFVIPIPLGLLVLLVSLGVKSFGRKRVYRPNKMCLLLFLPAVVCALVALSLFGFVETSANYPYVHSTWHILIACSLVFLLPRCRTDRSRRRGKNREDGKEDDNGSAQTDSTPQGGDGDSTSTNNVDDEDEVEGSKFSLDDINVMVEDEEDGDRAPLGLEAGGGETKADDDRK